MDLQFNHKSNYFLAAQLVIRHIQDRLFKEKTDHVSFSLQEWKHLFQNDMASASVNLDGILHLASKYVVETLSGDTALIHHYDIHANEHTTTIFLNESAVNALIDDAHPLIPPDAATYE
ncbi:hypothetical protein I2F27_09825 [Acinetobacter sp. B5B]|uniref:hypothetical protein n=1 Tax=Acinetobacter baretiae TaxID=2605383 RepID=UPI0018C33600|nr:hypothetical protein [Acinetobacter baretiae]MBF7683619.1 hypothetical protein [Acinetobacter baretiae]MBF7686058.1 hypothetical protein [Acinetobacter baretiae]